MLFPSSLPLPSLFFNLTLLSNDDCAAAAEDDDDNDNGSRALDSVADIISDDSN